MSVQLIVYPQNYQGFSNSNNPSTELIVDGINFTTVNASDNFFVGQPNGAQEAINFYNPTLAVNTWKRYKVGSSGILESGGSLSIAISGSTNQQGIIQKLSNLTVGAVYNIVIDCTLLVNGNIFNLSIFSGTVLQSSQPFPITAINTVETFQFTANSTEDTIVIGGKFSTGNLITSNISITAAPNQPSGAIQILGDGQALVDLYEDEDLPLSLSVDDFKNVAEQVQSYSKAFNVPATKRNNRIFDHIFEVTREVESAGSLLFNPYKKTKCVLKQDGFILFEGYLRMLDITDKEGETSYNVNLYSEVIALADLLQDRTFRDLDFTELTHDYNKTNIKRSWNDFGNSITYTNAGTSGFRDAYTTLRYPFVDWNHQFIIAATGGSPTAGNPQLSSLEQAFRPFINVKYIIDRIFEATDFTYESTFFNDADFNKLYMDFNWGADNSPVDINSTKEAITDGSTTAGNFPLYNTLSQNSNNFNSDFGYSGGVYTAQTDNQTYNFNYAFTLRVNNATIQQSFSGECRWKLVKAGVTTYLNETPFGGIVPATSVSNAGYIGNILETLNIGDTLTPEFTNDASFGSVLFTSEPTYTTGQALPTVVNISSPIVTTDIILQTLRGELGQWDFLKGLITMFNLVSLPDENNPNNIKIEPYSDVFINNPDSVELNWTDKIDVSEMKLTPLADLNRKTIFKFVEDEIVAEPFAATVVKPLMDNYPQFITPAIYSYNPQDDTSEGFENSPRIMYNNGVKSTGASYFIPEQNGLSSENQTSFLQFSHLSLIPSTSAGLDFHFGECQLIQGVGDPTANNLYNLYWSDYYNELYNPNTRTMTIKVNLSPADINTFKFNDTVYIKNRIFRVNKIDYKPNSLATVEFILIT